jgi:hypothetical protein
MARFMLAQISARWVLKDALFRCKDFAECRSRWPAGSNGISEIDTPGDAVRLRQKNQGRKDRSVAAGRFAAVTTTAAAAIAATATVATAAALAFRTSFVDIQGSAAHFMAIDGGDGPVAFRVIGHFDERKASGLACVAVGYYTHAVDCAMGFKQRTDVLFSGVETKISHKNILHFGSAFWI